jgi:hypothetical protein
MERSMIEFRYVRGRGRGHTTPTRVSQRLVLLAIIALASTLFAASGALASTSGRAETNCKIVVAGAPWKIATRSGSNYTLAARGMSCATARPWAVKFTHQTAGATGKAFKGPSGFTCRSFSTTASGDKLLYSGVCMKGPHNHPFFEWGPKV